MRLLIIVALFWSSGVMGTVLRPQNFSTLQERATHISVSEVTGLEPFWHSGRILTWVTLNTSTSFRGDSSQVRLLIPGGTIDGISQKVPGGPDFALGEVSLYFLEPMSKFDGLRLVGFTHGKVNKTGVMAQQFEGWIQRLVVLRASGLPQSGAAVRGQE